MLRFRKASPRLRRADGNRVTNGVMPKLLAPIALVSALALGVSACGSSSSTTTTSSAAGSGTGNTISATTYEARLNLAKCLRSHGLNVPDPSANGGIPGGGGTLRTIRSQPNFQAAMNACSQYVRQAFPRLNLTPAQRAQFQRDAVKFAECMRAHGINIPDPTPGAGGGFGIRAAISNSESNSPAFQSALQTCRSNLPFRRGAGGAVGG
jgi:hypothetical protein